MKLSKLGIVFTSALYIILAFTTVVTKASKCSHCKTIVDDFKEGLEKTKKSNFGGGNTRWEEKSLGTWANSETRLVEIWEKYLCKHDSKECQLLLEKHEEDVEDYYFNVFGKKDNVDMQQWLCISRLKVCCQPNRYGPKCQECPGGKDRPCTGNGKCDGEGTRGGTGKCSCDDGYRGDVCNECIDNFYEEVKNDTHTICKKCHESCKSTCWEAGPKGCDECKSGWEASETDGCVDVNECADSPCEENQYCVNTPGKYNCATCHKACSGCKAYGAQHCEACAEGYREESNNCIDVNECTEDTSLCTGDKQSCKNTEGSYICECEGDFIYHDSSKVCLPKPKEPPKPRKSENKKQKKQKVTDSDKPSLLLLLGMIVIYYICCTMVQWNLIVVFCLSTVLAVFVYWFGTQHDRF